jgi:hypothetical protein
MINGRWVESNEIFEKLPTSQSSQESQKIGDLSVLIAAPEPSRAAFASCAAPEDQDQQKCHSKTWKEIRFREVLLSQTDQELSLIQV